MVFSQPPGGESEMLGKEEGRGGSRREENRDPVWPQQGRLQPLEGRNERMEPMKATKIHQVKT